MDWPVVKIPTQRKPPQLERVEKTAPDDYSPTDWLIDPPPVTDYERQ